MKNGARGLIWAGVGVALLLAAFVSPFASSAPDGLDRVAKDHGFAAKAEAAALWTHAPAKDYAMPGVRNAKAAIGAAGALGALGAFVAAIGVARLLVARRKRETR